MGDYNKKEDSVSSIAPTFEKNLEQFNKNFKKKLKDEGLPCFEDNASEFEYQNKIEQLKRDQESKSVTINMNKKKSKCNFLVQKDDIQKSSMNIVTQKDKKEDKIESNNLSGS